jgi:hypothetical protein
MNGNTWQQYCESNGASLYVAWCNGQRMTVRKLSAIYNWIKWQLWAEWERADDVSTDEARRLSDVLAAVNCDIAKLQK